MENLDLLGFLIITLNCNMTIVGILWLVVAVLLRMLVVVLAGSPIYQDEQERFVCNTLQPGCANVCYDFFFPVSPLRFWLVQSLALLLPSVVFGAYALNRGAKLAAEGTCRPRVPDLSSAYLVHLLLRTLLEAGLASLHYLLYGFSVPNRVSCSRVPCSGAVDCYVSRPTEKSLLMLFVWAVSALSFLLSLADLLCSLRRTRGTMQGVKGEARPVCKVSTLPPGLLQDPQGCHSQGQVDRENGQEEQGVPEFTSMWTAGQGGDSHDSHQAIVSGRMEHSDQDDSEATSLVGDRLAVAHREPFRSHRETSADLGVQNARSGEIPLVTQSHLARHCSASQPVAPGLLATSGSAPHLRTKKSEWV
ncbi:gap junction delta-4 protein [Phodopus roborovskii]|uniref:Gap junction protein n=1 Tax=Phodopus roborovskii TaxID=109678 RepID=A0AAV0A710_PHORO|nr:LOW QUALITY PROTEIN: gap junction delta-4 protein-like [Phodopus roborovskii]XP_051061716.1 gap junction delta-4 protein [Phodopus roborovskii]CAH7286102.1 Gjd4 [Phodopus roborovskii]